MRALANPMHLTAAHPFPIEVLALPAAGIFLVSLLIGWWATRNPLIAIVVALIKAGVFVLYFGLFFDASFTVLDDWSYLLGGAELLSLPWGAQSLSESLGEAFLIAGGQHVLYYLFNAVALKLLGAGYFAPVACNVIITVITAWAGTQLAAQHFRVVARLRPAFFVFLALHPSILAWSTVLNLKDQLVLLAHVLLLWSVSLALTGRSKAVVLAAFTALTVSSALAVLRAYVPLLFAVALLGLLAVTKGMRYLPLGVLLVASMPLVYVLTGNENGLTAAVSFVSHAVDVWSADFVNPLYGVVRFVLTPVPFGTTPEYAFLDLPALVHWLFLPFAVIGVRHVVATRTSFSAFFLSYVLIFVFLYGSFGELQGPRHRIQLDYAFALLQFLGAVAMLRYSCQGQFRPPLHTLGCLGTRT